MRYSSAWKDYELIDCSSGERLERWGDKILIRPDPQVIWNTPKDMHLWSRADAVYHRSNTGGGHWQVNGALPQSWKIAYKDLTFNVKTMGFKHTGIFPEQAVNWDMVSKLIKAQNREVKVLNLFAYTGAATVAALKAGASVVHVDASKGMVQWAIRRGNRYDIIIMDPPSYGRGPGGEVWKLENEVYGFVDLCKDVLSDDPLLMLINSYTTGLSPSVMQYILGSVVAKKFGGTVSSDEIGLPVKSTGMVLPCGASAIWTNKKTV